MTSRQIVEVTKALANAQHNLMPVRVELTPFASTHPEATPAYELRIERARSMAKEGDNHYGTDYYLESEETLKP